MAARPQAFYCLWQDKEIRERLFTLLSKEDICNVRLASSACCNLVTKRLFLRTHLTFTANTFTRESRVQALSRIGHHIEHLTFYFPHSDATFLPPLVHPETGREVSFLYTPHTSMASVLERPKFANSSLGEILTLQYPPLFHAASNVPSFINAMKHLPRMRHLTIKTPGQDPKERYRRDIVDYALISLRIALERAPLNELTKLSLSSVHPSAFIYLRHTSGFGCLPSAVRRWRQIRKLHIAVESWDFYGPSPGLDHLKMIDDFIRSFSGSLEKFTFKWLGRKGPCPLSLAADPLFAPPRNTQKLFHEVTSPMSPLPPTPPRKPVVFRNVRYLAVRNATMNALQVSDLVHSHRHCVREFDFENVVLIDAGNWDDALAPLMDNTSQGEHWTRHSMATISDVGSIRPEVLAEDIPAHSAAVAAVSQELLDLDINLFRDEEGETQESEDIDLPSDIEAARKASLLFPNKLKKRRVTKRRRKRKESHQRREEEADMEQRAGRNRRDRSEESLNQPDKEHQPLRRFWHKRSKDSVEQPQTSATTYSTPNHSRQPSNESLNRPQEPPRLVIPHQTSHGRLFGEVESIHSSTSSRQLFGEITPGSGSEPELSHSPIDEQEEDSYYFRPQTPPTPTPKARAVTPPASSSKPTIAKPMMEISAPILDTSPAMPTLLQPTVYDPTADLCSEISAVQRDIEAEEAQRLVAEDAEVQTSALRKAKELVLSRLAGRDFYGTGVAALNPKSSFRRDNGGIPRKESFSAGSFLSSARFREGLFGRSTSVVNMAPVSTDHRSMDVPILFSRC